MKTGYKRKEDQSYDGVSFSTLKGKTLSEVRVAEDQTEIEFYCTDGSAFLAYHSQDCCGSVAIESIVGDLQEMVGQEILEASEETNSKEPVPKNADCFTWTFYKLATTKGHVDIRWLGESNGYYSESVYLDEYSNKPSADKESSGDE